MVHIEKIPDLNQSELNEYLHAVQEYETAIRKSFKPERINHLMLGNVEPHVHYHMMPRYSSQIKFAGLTFEDSNYPKMSILNPGIKEQRTLKRIIDNISENL